MGKSVDLQSRFAEQLLGSIKSANEGITHADFVEGVKNGSLGFKVMFGEPSKLLYGARKTMFNLYVMLYMIGPLVIIPFLAYHADNWWLLFGIVSSYLFSFFATFKANNSNLKWLAGLFFYFLIYSIVHWIRSGFHFYDYTTFFFFSSLWGTFFFKLAEQAQFDYALRSLTENAQLFNWAIEKNQIMIVHKEAEDNSRREQLSQDKASRLLDMGDDKFNKGDYNAAIDNYTKSIEFYPFVSAFENRGYAKMKLRNFKGAIQDFTSSLDRMPSVPSKVKFANIYRQRAEAYKALGMTKEADFDLEQAIKLSNE